MTRDEDIRAYAKRPWKELEEAKHRYWSEAELSPVEALRMADRLRRSVRSLRPDWPDPHERDRDVRAHVQLAADFLRIGT